MSYIGVTWPTCTQPMRSATGSSARAGVIMEAAAMKASAAANVPLPMILPAPGRALAAEHCRDLSKGAKFANVNFP